jgi:hypothetical protein
MKIIKEFKDIGSFIDTKLSNQSKCFDVFYNLDTKKYSKVYNKQIFIEGILPDLDTSMVIDHLIPFFHKKKYTFLPELQYETENHLFFEYCIDYNVPKANDFIDSPISRLNNFFNIPYKEKNLKPTILFKEIVNDFKNMYIKEKIYDPIPADMGKILATKLNFKANTSKLNYLTITPSNISLRDFVVKRDKCNNIIDWKFVDMENFKILPPRYIFNLHDKGYYPIDFTDPDYYKSDAWKRGGHDVINYEQVLPILDNNDIVYCFDKKWHTYNIE